MPLISDTALSILSPAGVYAASARKDPEAAWAEVRATLVAAVLADTDIAYVFHTYASNTLAQALSHLADTLESGVRAQAEAESNVVVPSAPIRGVKTNEVYQKELQTWASQVQRKIPKTGYLTDRPAEVSARSVSLMDSVEGVLREVASARDSARIVPTMDITEAQTYLNPPSASGTLSEQIRGAALSTSFSDLFLRKAEMGVRVSTTYPDIQIYQDGQTVELRKGTRIISPAVYGIRAGDVVQGAAGEECTVASTSSGSFVLSAPITLTRVLPLHQGGASQFASAVKGWALPDAAEIRSWLQIAGDRPGRRKNAERLSSLLANIRAPSAITTSALGVLGLTAPSPASRWVDTAAAYNPNVAVSTKDTARSLMRTLAQMGYDRAVHKLRRGGLSEVVHAEVRELTFSGLGV